MSSPFKTFTGIDEYEFVPGVHIRRSAESRS